MLGSELVFFVTLDVVKTSATISTFSRVPCAKSRNRSIDFIDLRLGSFGSPLAFRTVEAETHVTNPLQAEEIIVTRAVVSRIIRIVLIVWLIIAGFVLWQLR